MTIPLDHDGIDYLDWTSAAKRGWSISGLAGFATIAVGTTTGRHGTRSINGATANATSFTLIKSFPTSLSSFTVIIGIYIDQYPTSNDIRLAFVEGSNQHLNLRVSTTGAVTLYRDNTPLSGVLFTATLDTYEVWMVTATIHDTTGAWSVSVDGTAKGSATGVDTRASGTGVVTGVQMMAGGSNTNGIFRIDDVNVFSGSVTHEDFHNDTVMPTGDGADADWDLSAGAAMYALLDEVPYNLSDYLRTANVGDACAFTYAAPATSGDIRALTWRPLLRAAVAGVRQVRAYLRIGGTKYPHATTVTLGSDDAYAHWSWDINPATAVGFVGGDFPLTIGLEVMA